MPRYSSSNSGVRNNSTIFNKKKKDEEIKVVENKKNFNSATISANNNKSYFNKATQNPTRVESKPVPFEKKERNKPVPVLKKKEETKPTPKNNNSYVLPKKNEVSDYMRMMAREKGLSDEDLNNMVKQADAIDRQKAYADYRNAENTKKGLGNLDMGVEEMSTDKRDADKTQEDIKNAVKKNYGISDEQFRKEYYDFDKNESNLEAIKKVADDRKFAEEHPLLGSLKSLATRNFGQTAEGIANQVASLQLGLDEKLGLDNDQRELNQKDFMIASQSDALREGASENMSDLGKGAYNLGMSAADMGVQAATAALTGGLSGVGMGLMQGAQISDEATRDSLNRGNSTLQAGLEGLGKGGVTTALTKFGVDDIIKANPKTIGQAALKGMFAEGTEEALENVAGRGIDNALSSKFGGTSETQEAINNYMAQGLTEEQAKEQVKKDRKLEVLQDFGAGALFGGVLGGVNGFNTNNNPYVDSLITENNGKTNTNNKVDVLNPKTVNQNADTKVHKVGDKIDLEDINVGQFTKLKNRYTGTDAPIQSATNNNVVKFDTNNVANAEANISAAEKEALASGKSKKGILKNMLKTRFEELTGGKLVTPVNNMSQNGEPYNVTVNKSAIGKLVSSGKIDGNTIAVLDHLQDVITDANYVGSAHNVDYKNAVDNKAEVLDGRYDYFETNVDIGGKNYVVSFSVESNTENNRYRTHQINEINLREGNVDRHGNLPSPDNPNGDLFDNNISQSQDNVNTDGNPNMKTSQFREGGTMEKSDVAPEEVMNEKFAKDLFQYESKTEQQSVTEALNMIDKEGADNVVTRLLGKEAFTQVDTDAMMSIAEDTVQLAMETDDPELWNKSLKIYQKVKEESSRSAQVLQSLVKWGKKTPMGMLMEAERSITKAAEAESSTSKLEKELTKFSENKKVDFSDDFRIEFLEMADEYSKLDDPESVEAQQLLAQMGRLVNEQIPSTVPEKVTTILMDNMLGNFRTLITRNFLGNAGFGALEQIKKVPASWIDKALSKKTGRRSVASLSPSSLASYANGFIKGLKDEFRDFGSDLHTSRSGEASLKQAIESNRHVFNESHANTELGKVVNKVLDKYDKMVKFGLSIGDRPYYEGTYAQTLEEYRKLGKEAILGKELSKKYTDEEFDNIAKLAANTNALAAVYQDNTLLSKAMTEAKKAVGDISKGIVGVDILSQFSMPFVKTPANIVTRSIEYSPFGVVKNAINTAKDIKNAGGIENLNAAQQSRIANETARNVLGTGLTGLGLAALQAGKMTGGYSDDAEEKAKQKADGMQEYAAQFGNKNMDISWIPIVGTNLVAGAAMQDAMDRDDAGGLESLAKGVKTGLGSLTEQSLFQGLQRMLGTSTQFNTDKTIMDNLVDTVKNGSSQLVPSLMRQVAQTTDEYERDTTGGDFQYSINAALPWMRQDLQRKVDSYGNDVLQNQGRSLGWRALENMVLPGKITELNSSALTKELDRLKDTTTEDTQYFKNYGRGDIAEALGMDKKDLTDKQFHDYKQALSSSQTEFANALITSEAYQNMSDEDKVQAINDAKATAKAIFRKNNQEGYEPTQHKREIAAYEEGGIDGYMNYVTDKAKAESLGITYDKMKKLEGQGYSEQDLIDFSNGQKMLDALNLSDDKVATALNALERADYTDEQKGQIILSNYSSTGVKAVADQYGDASAYYTKNAQAKYDSITGDDKTQEKKQLAYNYVNSLKVSDDVKGAIMLNTDIASSKQYQEVADTFGNAAVYQLFNMKQNADTMKDKDKKQGSDGRVSKKEAIAYINANGLDGKIWFPYLVSSASNNPY